MRPAFPTASRDWRRQSPRQRALAIALTLAAELIFVILLLSLIPSPTEEAETPREPLTLDLAAPTPEAKRSPRPEASKSAKATAQSRPITPPLPPTPPLAKSPLVEISKEDFAASDITKLGSSGAAAGSRAAAMGPGEGPGGARLYNAEWVVEPTNAQIAYYMPDGTEAGSSADIACKTIENYRVENCTLLSESPMGSGLARAMRLAAWQFKVRPPRIDGKPLIGVWVRIHFDFGTKAE